jgi:hypothetical protein
MGANSKQAVALVLTLLAFTALAGALAGGGIILWVVALALLGGASFVFMKAKPLEYEE